MDMDNTIARLENIAKHAVHTAGEDIFILNLDDGIAIHEAIEALKAQLSHESTTSDLISRQAAIDGKIVIQRTNGVEIYYDEAVTVGYLKNLPSVQPEPKEGRWIRRDCGLDVECKCSKCGYRDFVEPRDEYCSKETTARTAEHE